MNKTVISATILVALLISACAVSTTHSNETDKPKALLLSQNEIALTSNFSDQSSKIGTVFDFFDVAVRTHNASFQSKPAAIGQTPKVNTVRMLGGWASKDIEGDAYKWDGKKFVYDFDVVTKRIDTWLANDWEIFQIVLDNPPWAFQQGFTLVDEPDGVHYIKKDALGVYGNSLPPADPVAWNRFIQALTKHLVTKYGKEAVLSWRFRVGSEIDTRPQHWSATRQEFFDHYKNTVDALHNVLPQAKVGAHFREASFKGNYIDYTGNTEDAYGPHFIEWAKKYNVHYDFVAISYYPRMNKSYELDMEHVYQHDVSPIQNHPDWNPNASLEIHEFRLITKMLRAGFVSVATSHGSSFFAMFSKMMLENNITELFQWGTGRNGNYVPELLTQFALLPMVGNALYANKVEGLPAIKGNRVDGIFTQRSNNIDYDILLFNFNATDFSYQTPEKAHVILSVEHPIGSQYEYRVGNIDKTNNTAQRFSADFPKADILIENGGWRNAELGLTSSLMKSLNKEGQKVYLANKNKYTYTKDSIIHWGEWQKGNTLTGDQNSSTINIRSELPSFAVQKIEVRVKQ